VLSMESKVSFVQGKLFMTELHSQTLIFFYSMPYSCIISRSVFCHYFNTKSKIIKIIKLTDQMQYLL
jgi:hypothetical protein